MQTVNLTCPHCGKLMALSSEWLGRQVRCPHCSGVVPTPAEAPGPPALAPTAAEPQIELAVQNDEPDSIFSPSDADDEGLFAGPVPQVEFPPEPAPPPREPTGTEPIFPEPAAAAEMPTTAFPSPLEEADEAGLPTTAYAGPELASDDEAAAESSLPVVTTPSAAVATRSRSGGWLMALVVVPLISYSILATIAIIILRTQPEKPHPLESIPDVEGDRPGATRKGKGQAVRYKVPPTDMPVPPQLRVGLGQTLVLGDLAVTPLRVERRRISIQVGDKNPDPIAEECLALDLRLRNVSQDVFFAPLDRFFTRSWKAVSSGSAPVPFTQLEMGPRRYYGGPTRWDGTPGSRGRFGDPIEVVLGQNYDRVLGPGEELTSFICTDPEDGVVRDLQSYQGPLLWRVQLRRGLVKWRTLRGVDREDPATAVIGVEFAASDVGDRVSRSGTTGTVPALGLLAAGETEKGGCQRAKILIY